eukprot:10733129-Alexandrium_andersonii.AAC.1
MAFSAKLDRQAVACTIATALGCAEPRPAGQTAQATAREVGAGRMPRPRQRGLRWRLSDAA